MRTLWRAFINAFWVALLKHAPPETSRPQVLTIRVEIDDADARAALDRLETRLEAFVARTSDIDHQWAVKH